MSPSLKKPKNLGDLNKRVLSFLRVSPMNSDTGRPTIMPDGRTYLVTALSLRKELEDVLEKYPRLDEDLTARVLELIDQLDYTTPKPSQNKEVERDVAVA